MKQTRNSFSDDEITAFAPSEKIGIVATTAADGSPHLTLLTSLMAAAPDQVVIGEFCKGESKVNMAERPDVAFAVVTLDKKLWRGRARWTHSRQDGPEYDVYNNQPMFRYNSYFGINTVHYLDLLEITGGEPLPMTAVVGSAILTKAVKKRAGRQESERVLTHFAERLFNRLDSLSFLSRVDADGTPLITPVVQCQAADSGRLAFHPGAFGDELKRLEAGSTVSLLCLSMEMESVMVRGVFEGFDRYAGVTLGLVSIERVYNSMPSNNGWIYPVTPLEPVVHF